MAFRLAKEREIFPNLALSGSPTFLRKENHEIAKDATYYSLTKELLWNFRTPYQLSSIGNDITFTFLVKVVF